MDELKPCPFCGGTKLEQWTVKELGYAVIECTDCHGKVVRDLDQDAIASWNRRPAPENKPLTIKQLRQMDGEPVKVVEDGEYQYGIVSLSGHYLAPKEEVITLCSGNFYLLREMVGNFEVYPAYTRRPEQEEK